MGKASRRPLQSTLSREPIHVCNGESVALHRPSCGGKSSKLERRFEHLWHALKGPELVREFQFHPTRKWRADFAHLPSRTLIEIEGGIWTQGRHNRAAGKQETFDHLRTLWRSGKPGEKPPLYPDGHPVRWTTPDGSERLLFGDPFPRLEMPATFEAWGDPSQWKALEPQQSVPSKDGREKVVPHRGSIAWNPHLRAWVAVFTQFGGKPSHLGEIWFARADSPKGPWHGAVKIASHNGRTFYNPRIHAELAGLPPDVILFEGTLSTFFTENAVPLPRHDYNQILYRLDLGEL